MVMRQKDCDFSDPRQRFVWALQNVGYGGFPIAFPPPVKEALSEHLSRCGFVHVSELAGLVPEEALPARQEIHFQPPVQGQDHYMNLSGEWVPVEQPVVEPEVLSKGQKLALIEEFRKEGLLD